MADWSSSSPNNSTLYSQVLEKLRDRDFDAFSLGLNSITNPITGMIRYNRSTDLFEEYNGSSWAAIPISLAGGGTGAANASDARTSLGLGTMATQNSNAVTITGGTIAGMTSIASSGIVSTAAYFSGSGSGLSSIPNSATTATNLNTGSAIVARDAGGNFSASTITANLTGNCSGNAGTVTNGVVTTGSYSDPSWITALSASKLTSGDLSDTRLSSNVALYNRSTHSWSGYHTAANQPKALNYHNINQSISNTTNTTLLFNTQSYNSHPSNLDFGAIYSFSTSNMAGCYLFIARVTFLAGAGTVRKVLITKDSEGDVARFEAVPSTTAALAIQAVGIAAMGAYENISVQAYQDSGSSLNVYGSGVSNTSLTVIKLW